jgi:hypothetical protein
MKHQSNPNIEANAIGSVQRFEKLNGRAMTAKAYPQTLREVDDYANQP